MTIFVPTANDGRGGHQLRALQTMNAKEYRSTKPPTRPLQLPMATGIRSGPASVRSPEALFEVRFPCRPPQLSYPLSRQRAANRQRIYQAAFSGFESGWGQPGQSCCEWAGAGVSLDAGNAFVDDLFRCAIDRYRKAPEAPSLSGAAWQIIANATLASRRFNPPPPGFLPGGQYCSLFEMSDCQIRFSSTGG